MSSFSKQIVTVESMCMKIISSWFMQDEGLVNLCFKKGNGAGKTDTEIKFFPSTVHKAGACCVVIHSQPL